MITTLLNINIANYLLSKYEFLISATVYNPIII